MLAGLPSRITPSGYVSGPVDVATSPDAGDSLCANSTASTPAPTSWTGTMMPSDADLDLTPWTLAESAAPADYPA